MSSNWCATWLIVIFNPILAIAISNYMGFEDDALEYVIKDSVVYYYITMIMIELGSVVLLKQFQFPFITAILQMVVFSTALFHASAFISYLVYQGGEAYYIYKDGIYFAIVSILTALQVFVFGISFHFDDRFPDDHGRIV